MRSLVTRSNGYALSPESVCDWRVLSDMLHRRWRSPRHSLARSSRFDSNQQQAPLRCNGVPLALLLVLDDVDGRDLLHRDEAERLALLIGLVVVQLESCAICESIRSRSPSSPSSHHHHHHHRRESHVPCSTNHRRFKRPLPRPTFPSFAR